MRLLDDHVRHFNEGVRSGDFGPMVAAFADDGELHFEGIPVGPFIGREAIAAAYREQPPDDEIEILGSDERDGIVLAVMRGFARTEGRQARCGSPHTKG